jgi:hypothetical protein
MFGTGRVREGAFCFCYLTFVYRNYILEQKLKLITEGGKMSLHEIEIEYGERYTDFVMSMYVDTGMADDIDMLGWNLCDCNDAVFQEKIGNCSIVKTVIENKTVKIVLEFSGNDLEIQEHTIDEMQDCWDTRVFLCSKGVLSRV